MPKTKKITPKIESKAGKKEKKKTEVKKVKKEKKAAAASRAPKKIKEKPIRVEKPEKKIVEKPVEKPVPFFEAVGRRKTAVARIRMLSQGEKVILVNGKPYQEYFSTRELQSIAAASLEKMKCLDKFRVLVLVRGGGLHAQAEAVRHGTARALVLLNAEFRKRLRKVGYLTRDPRMRERKKFGLKRARRAPQWQKR